MGDRRLAVAFATASLVLLAYGLSLMKPWRQEFPLATDFVSFWTGASLLREGIGPALYDLEIQRALQVGLRLRAGAPVEIVPGITLAAYYNPPPLALLLVPFTLLPLPWAALAWSAVNLLAVVAAVAIHLRGSIALCISQVTLRPTCRKNLFWRPQCHPGIRPFETRKDVLGCYPTYA